MLNSKLLNEIRKLHRLILFLTGIAPFVTIGISQNNPDPVTLNEFMASNVTVFPDNHDFDDYSDWLELKNSSPEAVDLNGYFLTDDLADPMKWAFPTGASIPGNGYLVVRADGMNAGPGESFVREFSPWDSFNTINYHTNFKLSAEGEELGLYRVSGGVQQIPLVDFGAEWTYWDQGGLSSSSWTEVNFDASLWRTGAAQLGYGESDEATILDYGSNSQNKHITYYFRKTFELADTPISSTLHLRTLIDDGAVIYLNGVEALRIRLPEGAIDSETRTLTDADENVIEAYNVPSDLLHPGINLVAVEVHQVNQTSSDVSFDLALSAQRFSGELVQVDSVQFDQQYPDISMGRLESDNNQWHLLNVATPGESNLAEAISSRGIAGKVSFSVQGGFYSEPQLVEITTTTPDTSIYYTLDGSIPTPSSLRFDSPILVNSTQVLRARAFASGQFPGPVNSSTYWIGEEPADIPTVSLIFDAETFFDSTIGIYSNAHKGMEAPLHMEFYDKSGQIGFSVNAGAKIGGENIWRFPQKPLNITLRGKYGDDLIPYSIFPEKRIGFYGQISLRNGGDNWYKAMIRDAMTPALAHGFVDSEIQSYRPCITYFNGQFWGIYNIREKLDPVYFSQNLYLNEGNYDYLEYAHTIGNEVSLVVDEGSNLDYLALEAFAENNDLTVEENYLAIGEMMDLDNFIDYLIFQNYVYNSSWRHNREFWKSRIPGSKWRWVIADLDRGLNISNINSTLIDNIRDGYPLAGALIRNTQFKRRLVQRHAAMLHTAFHPERIKSIVDQYANEVDSVIDSHIERWANQGGISSRNSRQSELDEIKQFAEERPAVVYSGINSHLNTSGPEWLHLDLQPAEAGVIYIEGIPWAPELTKSLGLFRNLTAEIEVRPNPGYRFSHWVEAPGEGSLISLLIDQEQNLTAILEMDNGSILEGTISQDLTLTAEQSPYSVVADLIVSPAATLNIQAGVEIRCLKGVDIIVQGAMNIDGNDQSPVILHSDSPDQSWGALIFNESSKSSILRHFQLRNATRGYNPGLFRGGISIFNSEVLIEDADIQCAAPIFAVNGDVTLRRSKIYTPFTGDGINVKGGRGRVEDCEFIGNMAPDTDAIDFDGVTEGWILRNRIYGFRGPNSDAIDIGEGARNLVIQENSVFNITDKGVSVGQASEAWIQRNLFVDCALGVAVKDYESKAYLDQNTFAYTQTGIAVYEKNLLKGGGWATAENCIFYENELGSTSQDSFSEVTVQYSISNNNQIPGSGNSQVDPEFTDPIAYNFSLLPGSPAIDAGNPEHDLDLDGSVVDIGAPYEFNANNFPFLPPNIILINEILSHSAGAQPDWIELYNPSESEVDVGGWFLSDDRDYLRKFEIPIETKIGPGDFLVFYEDIHFGVDSIHPGKRTGFALSSFGETVFLYAPGGELSLPYLEQESFGPSEADISRGRFEKPTTGTINFIPLSYPTPGEPNAYPRVGPLTITEIHYHPAENAAAEFIEIQNISAVEQTLSNEATNEFWQFTDGIEFNFSRVPPIQVAAGEIILLVKDLKVFQTTYSVPTDVQIFQWDGGSLSNQGEKLELSKSGELDTSGTLSMIRIDRIVYDDNLPWPEGADGSGLSLHKISPELYGNDVDAWHAASPSPGIVEHGTNNSFMDWTISAGLSSQNNAKDSDPDNDGIPNILEWLMHTNPLTSNNLTLLIFNYSQNTGLEISLLVPGLNQYIDYILETSIDLSDSSHWIQIPINTNEMQTDPNTGHPLIKLPLIQTETVHSQPESFYRLKLNILNN